MARRAGRPGGRLLAAASILLALWTAGCRTGAVVRPEVSPGGGEEVHPRAETAIRERILEAQRLFDEGRIGEAKDMIAGLEARSEAPWFGELQMLRARIALSEAEPERSLIYLNPLLAMSSRLEAPLRFEAHLLRADLAYAAHDWDEAHRNYLQAFNACPTRQDAPSRIALRLGEIALYQYRDPERARFHLEGLPSSGLSAEEQNLLGRLKRRLAWRTLGAQTFGLDDLNISALELDGDDLWIGSWNGGVSRYSLASGEATVFREGRESLVANTVRSIEITPSRVWIGTYQGLFAYSKATSRWQEIEAFRRPEPKKVEALRYAAGRLFVGTLGDGLWIQEGGDWLELSGGGLPGDFVSCLEQQRGMLLIGTLNRGLVLMDLEQRRFRSFDTLSPDLQARNITMLLADGSDALWIGTYGMGLYRWSWSDAKLQHFTRRTGHLGDDWVLCGLIARSGLYFGTLGGGITRYRPEDGQWQVIGVNEGLASRDISAMAYGASSLFLGTLGAAIAVYTEPKEPL